MAEERARRPVGEEDRSARVGDEDRVGRRFGEAAQAQLALGQGLLRDAPLAADGGFAQLALEDRPEAGEVRVSDAILGAGLHRPDRVGLRQRLRDDHEGDVEVPLSKQLERFESGQARCGEVREHDVPAFGRESVLEVRAAVDAPQDRIEASPRELLGEESRVGRTAVHQQGPNGNTHCRIRKL